MSLPRLDHSTRIADQLNLLAAMVKSRSRASLSDANRILETITARFLNALFGWDLESLNTHQANYPAADLGDRRRRLAIQVTNEEGSDKIRHTATKAIDHQLSKDFDQLILFFLLSKKPGFPRDFAQPTKGPEIVTWDIADLLRRMQDVLDLEAVERASKVLSDEICDFGSWVGPGRFDVSRILEYAPAQLIGREGETKLLNDAWAKVQDQEKGRPHILTLVALGGEGKTSLVAKWAAELAALDWPGCDGVFAWSFYSQGTREQQAASSDLFLKEALNFFGDEKMANSNQGAFEKGRRLAQLCGERRSLVILDGLEPLQYAPTSPTPGELKDDGIRALLRGLATNSHGLCLVTTRYSLPDLRAFWQTTALEVKLLRLSRDAGVHLLKTLGVRGSAQEFETLVEDVKGHALTLQIMGSFLSRAFSGDIRQRDRVKFQKADEKIDGGHAFRVMTAYAQWMEDGSDEAKRELAILRCLGLFDRPAARDCLDALNRTPAIAGLTEPLVGVAEDDWQFSLDALNRAGLLALNCDSSGAVLTIDTHPHIREYFAKQLREKNYNTWGAAHKRLYEHLCATTPDKAQPTLEDLQPLYQAVAHGCQGGLFREACNDTYKKRILRGHEYYSGKRLGAQGADLGAIASFFSEPWRRIVSDLSESDQAWLLNEAAFMLRALGRLGEAIEPMKSAIVWAVGHKHFAHAALAGSNLAELELALGDIPHAIVSAEQSVAHADQSDDEIEPVIDRAMLAYALFQAGRYSDARRRLTELEPARTFDRPHLVPQQSDFGFRYFELSLREAELGAWWWILTRQSESQLEQHQKYPLADERWCRYIKSRAERNLAIHTADRLASLVDIGLDHLIIGRTELYSALFRHAQLVSASCELEAAIQKLSLAADLLRRAGDMTHLPRGMMTLAMLDYVAGEPGAALTNLEDAWEIAERGPMRLFLADIHLYRARLFFREKHYPWESPAADLAAAEKLINDCGYHRRDEELADAKAVILRS